MTAFANEPDEGQKHCEQDLKHDNSTDVLGACN